MGTFLSPACDRQHRRRPRVPLGKTYCVFGGDLNGLCCGMLLVRHRRRQSHAPRTMPENLPARFGHCAECAGCRTGTDFSFARAGSRNLRRVPAGSAIDGGDGDDVASGAEEIALQHRRGWRCPSVRPGRSNCSPPARGTAKRKLRSQVCGRQAARFNQRNTLR